MSPATSIRCTTLLTLFLLLIQDVHAYAKFHDGEKNCTIVGDNEIYGRGIRISLYMQWAGSVLATWICPDQIKITRTGTNIVAFAVMINTLKGGNEGGLLVPELFIVTNLVFTLNFFNIPPKMGLLKQSVSSLGAMFVVWSMALFAAPWVWFKNVDQGRKAGCVVKLWFVFTPVNIYNPGWRIFFKVSAVFECVLGFACVIGAIGALVFGTFMQLRTDGGGIFGNNVEDDDPIMGIVMKSIVSVLQLICGGVAIGMVERTIKTNNIGLDESVQSSGQLVPLIIGAVTLAATIGSGIKNLILKLKGPKNG